MVYFLFQDVFARIDGMSAVTKQPASKDDNIKALQVIVLSIFSFSCNAIVTK
jgi:hypothetical protein